MSEPGVEIPVKLGGIGAIRAEIKSIKGDIADTLGEINKVTEEAEKLRDAIAKANSAEEAEKLNQALSENEKQLKQLTQRNAELSNKAGEVSDRMRQINEQVSVFTTGSPFEKVSQNLGLVSSQLLSLDFEGAAESAVLLQKNISSITAEDVDKQMKGLQSTFSSLGKVAGTSIVGVIKNIGGLSKAFISFGASLLVNPIFLIAAAIVAIVAAIVALLSKLGLLKPILDAIGKVFEWIGWVIDKIVEGFNMLTDWLGLTNIAAEESAKRQTEAAERKAEAYEKSSKRIIFALDEEIKINQINGEKTFSLEVEKQRSIKQTAEARLEALKAKFRENKLTEELDEEELKTLKKNIQDQKDAIKTALSEIRIIRAQEKADEKKEQEKSNKDAEAAAKEAAAKAKQFAQNRLKATRQLIDLDLAQLSEGLEKEIAINTEKYRRLIEDTKRDETLLKKEKSSIIQRLEAEQSAKESEIKKAADEKRLQQEAAFQDQLKKLIGLEGLSRQQIIEQNAAAEIEVEKKKLEKKEINERQFAEISAQIEINKNAAIQKIQEEEEKRQRDALLQLSTTTTEEKKRILAEQMAVELSATELLESEKQLIREKYQKQAEELNKKEIENRKKVEEMKFQAVNNGLSLISSVTQLFAGNNEKAAKRAFNVNKGVAIAQTLISTYQAAQAAYASQLTIPDPSAPIRGAFAAAAAVASGLVKVKEIAKTKFEGGSASAPSAGATQTAAPETQTREAQAAPQLNLFGGGNQFNTASGAKSAESGQQFTVKAIVVADEMTAAQNLEKRILKAATLGG